MNKTTQQFKTLLRKNGQFKINKPKFIQINKLNTTHTQFNNNCTLQMLGKSFDKKMQEQQSSTISNNSQKYSFRNDKYCLFKKGQKNLQGLILSRKRSLQKQNVSYDLDDLKRYCGRLTAKQICRNDDFNNAPSPLQAWKQISNQYFKEKRKQNLLKTYQKKQNHYHSQQQLQKTYSFINGKTQGNQSFLNCNNTKNSLNNQIHYHLNLSKQKLGHNNEKLGHNNQKLLNKQRNQTEKQLQRKIILKKSLSCKMPGNRIKITVKTDNFSQSFLTQQSETTSLKQSQLKQQSQLRQQPQIKQQSQIKQEYPQQKQEKQQPQVKQQSQLKLSKKRSKQQQDNPIILLHKQSLDSYMSLFFKPLKQTQDSPIVRPVLRSLMRVKSKKLTTRNIQHLQQIKNNLFKQKSRQNLHITQSQYQSKDLQAKYRESLDMQNKNQLDQSGHTVNNKIVTFKFQNKSRNQSNQIDNQNNAEIDEIVQPLPIIQTLRVENDNGFITPQIQKVQPTSSIISFASEITPQKADNQQNGQSYFNAW